MTINVYLKALVKGTIHTVKSPLATFLLTGLKRQNGVPGRTYLGLLKNVLDFQLNPLEMESVLDEINKRRPCRFLVFGLGYDSVVWTRFNKGGETIFLEDNRKWISKIGSRYKNVKTIQVKYATLRHQWRELLQNEPELQMQLPKEVTRFGWDVVLVDGPAGAFDNEPGRMQSIYAASKLVAREGVVFVHDVDRQIEDVYTNRYLDENRMLFRRSRLRCYQF